MQGAAGMINHAILTVKMVGVTKAQQTFQKMFFTEPLQACKETNGDGTRGVVAGGEMGQGTAGAPLTHVPLAGMAPSCCQYDPYYVGNHQTGDSLLGR